MSEQNTNLREVFFGLEEYLKFCGNEEDVYLTNEIGKAFEAEDIQSALLSIYVRIISKRNPSDKIFRGINNYLKDKNNPEAIQDAMSRSQIKSKIWLIDELTKIKDNIPAGCFHNILILAGWFGQLRSIYDKKLTYRKMRFLDIDRSACQTSDYIFNLSDLENYKVKAVCADITQLNLHNNGYEWSVENFKDGTNYNEKFLPDLIINTSAEHMTEEWFHQIRFKELESDPIVALQSNNMFDGADHINCVHSIDHMKKKFPMREILFEGELQLKGYKRVMLIGRP
jgi:hypothetical protein